MVLPENVRSIIEQIEAAGYEAYAVGGCVRDSLLDKEPNDWDVTTSARPEQVKELFKRTVDTGIKHGTVTVMLDKEGYEVTTYRIDGEYTDGRHPESVEFASNLIEDLKRRDFTINAMAYNESNGLVDEFDGKSDLANGIVRCVGDACERFTEDALRMMRAIRFAAQLSFSIEADTYEAIKKLAPNIKYVSMERVQVELVKTIMSDNPEKVADYYDTGIMTYIMPQLCESLGDRYRENILATLKHAKKNHIIRYAALLRFLEPDEVKRVLKELKLDNYTVDNVTKLVECSKVDIPENEPAIREALHSYGVEMLEFKLDFDEAVVAAKEEVTGIILPGKKNHIAAVRKLMNDIINRGDCFTVKELDITGNDLMELGLSGKEIGQTLNKLLQVVIDNPKMNDKMMLLAMLERDK